MIDDKGCGLEAWFARFGEKMDEESEGIHLDSPWSQLVSTAVEESDDGEVVPIIGNKLSIGRKRGL